MDTSESQKLFGNFDDDTYEINLRKKFAASQQEADTVLHETLHAIWKIADLKPKDGEERIIRMMATHLCAIIQANPDLMAWLQESLAE